MIPICDGSHEVSHSAVAFETAQPDQMAENKGKMTLRDAKNEREKNNNNNNNNNKPSSS